MVSVVCWWPTARLSTQGSGGRQKVKTEEQAGTDEAKVEWVDQRGMGGHVKVVCGLMGE